MLKKLSNWFWILILQFILWLLIQKSHFFCELFYQHFTLKYNSIIGSITTKFLFPIGELFYIIFITGLIFLLINLIKLKSLHSKFKLLFITLNSILFVYQMCWGIVYYVNKFEIDSAELKVEVSELKDLYCNYLNDAEKERNKLKSKYDETLILNISEDQIVKEFEKNETLLSSLPWIKNYQFIQKPIIKYSNISHVMNLSGILGYYNPFTIYHELSHQMGFASENEANFVAFLIGYNSSNPEIRYSTLYKTSFSILANIAKSDPLFVKIQLDNLPKSIQLDYEKEKKYYKKYDGKMNDIFSEMNNQFLKANNQEGSISYSKYILLVNYYHKKKS